MIDWLLGLEPSESIALAAAVVAVCSLVLSVYEGYMTRKHGRLMVEPDLTIARLEVDGIFGIRNVGLGPARMDSLCILFQDKKYPLYDDQSWAPLLEALGAKEDLVEGGLGLRTKFSYYSQNSMVPAGTFLELMKFQDKRDLHPMPEWASVLFKLPVALEYKSIHGEKFTNEVGSKLDTPRK